jgi:uncharacterized protein (TIGR03435 family)
MSKRITIAAILALAVSTVAQQTTPEKKLSFDVVSIRKATTSNVRNLTTIANPRRITMQNINLIWLTYYAYGSGMGTAVRVTGGPDWAGRDGFDIQGLASQNSTEREFRLMVRTMLEERFAIKVRVQDSMGDMLGLFLDKPDGKLGPNVQEWKGTCEGGKDSGEDDPTIPRCGGAYRAPGIVLEGVSMFNVSEILSLPLSRNLLGTIVSDHTGLKGRYNMKLEYQFPPVGQPQLVAGPSLQTALKEQWGLKVEQAKGPFKSVVIESAEQPTEN